MRASRSDEHHDEVNNDIAETVRLVIELATPSPAGGCRPGKPSTKGARHRDSTAAEWRLRTSGFTERPNSDMGGCLEDGSCGVRTRRALQPENGRTPEDWRHRSPAHPLDE